MKRTPLLCFAIFGLLFSATAHPVDMESAKAIASKFMGTNDLQLAATYTTDNNAAAFYVLNSANGFVIVAADDCETPIIGYSREGRFDPNNVPVQMEEYLQDFVARIQYGIENHIEANQLTARQWELVKTTGQLNDNKSAQAVAPLLTTKWHQGCRYNSLCPAGQGPCEHFEVGCVAVAMGQIMHYWGYPSTGWGSHSYNNSGVTLSADFGNTQYDWDHMPDSLTENSSEAEIEAVATLLYHCGVSVDMKYKANGSTAKSADVPNALIRYFDYSRRVHREKKDDYSDEEWISMLKNDLDQQRPLLYSGSSSNVGHAFVCDGYDTNDLFHFNWGWGVADGYFALGNLNPIGYDFNATNFAILDISPQYEPCIVTASAFPSNAGTIEGIGEYHFGDQCALTAAPSENGKFYYWKRNGQIVSYDLTYRFTVFDDTNDIEAVFSYLDIKQIMASYTPDANDPNCSSVSLSWDYDGDNWALLKEFDIEGEKHLATDGEYIYTSFNYWEGYPNTFGKYTMNGELVEFFDIEGACPEGLACDGNYFYCANNNNSFSVYYLYRYDFANKTLVDSIYTDQQFTHCAYDAEHDGFWLFNTYQGNRIVLINRQGQTIMTCAQSLLFENLIGLGTITAKDGNSHVLIIPSYGYLYDLDITGSSFVQLSHIPNDGYFYGAFIGKYDGKDALFAIVYYYNEEFYEKKTIQIYEIKNTFAQIVGYRLYRTDSNGNTVMLADEVAGTSYIDETWGNAVAGMYRYGISEVYYNGVESEIIWSDPIEKNDYGLEENQDGPTIPTVQKVFEDGHIVIVKDGKRYTVTGQRLK